MSGFSHCKRKIVHIGFLILLSCLAVRCDSDSDLKFSESGGTYNHDIFVDLSLDTDSALSCAGSSESSTIYYTTDGSEPNPNTSNSYYGPIKVSGDGTVMTISAATFNSDNTIDQYAYETYTISYSDTGNN
ncbi:MAG TPA: chitobiase/beta-hexosaminidase C-terminal domain-containing protein, partial [Spirochaetota bacterium]|nr:chitobiase/beta-hexosaminidase C-terminal domain-containing protein [Spirochaetota bacterium]